MEVAMKSTLRCMDSTGDSVVDFDVEVPSKARDEAAALFERMTGKGAVAFQINQGEGQPDKPVKSFNDVQGDVVLVPRIVGG
jgi:hypothetical protein